MTDDLRRRPVVAVRIVQAVLGGILILAAGLKGFVLATEPVPGTDMLSSRWFLVTLVEFELLFGLWLLAGLYLRVTWWVAVGVFVLLAEVSLYKAASGESSCGCFGKVEVNPWYTLLLDVSAIASLVICRPNHEFERSAKDRRKLAGFAIVACGAGIPFGIAMATYTPTRLSADAEFIGDGKVVLLEPETWVGRRFPLLKLIDVGEWLQHGDWVVVLHRHDCPKCQHLIPQYEMLAERQQGVPNTPRIALIEIPPYGADNAREAMSWIAQSSACLHGKLLPVRDWFVQAPAVLQITDGQVIPVEDVFNLVDERNENTSALTEPPD